MTSTREPGRPVEHAMGSARPDDLQPARPATDTAFAPRIVRAFLHEQDALVREALAVFHDVVAERRDHWLAHAEPQDGRLPSEPTQQECEVLARLANEKVIAIRYLLDGLQSPETFHVGS